jgi:hypothetical protein
MASIADIAGATRDSIGRYFSLVSFIPSALLVAYVFALLSSGALHRSPDLRSVTHSVSHLGLADVAALTLLSVGLGLALHPLQFAFVQFFEGYWGTREIAQRARSARIWWHWRRLEAMRFRSDAVDYQLGNQEGNGDRRRRNARAWWHWRLPEVRRFRSDAADYQPGSQEGDTALRERIQMVSLRDEQRRLCEDQPKVIDQIMPTRLGNVLRYYESAAGAPYQLEAIGVMPYLARVAPAEDMAYVNDQRSNLDLAVRMILVSMIAFIITVVLLWRYGLWLLVAIVPYALAILSYRGAVVAASAYGKAFAAIIALNRFALYERLHLPLPRNTAEERKNNEKLSRILGYSEYDSLKYLHPDNKDKT